MNMAAIDSHMVLTGGVYTQPQCIFFIETTRQPSHGADDVEPETAEPAAFPRLVQSIKHR